MKVVETPLQGLLLIETAVFEDERGYFTETWNERRYAAAGIPGRFVQDNLSYSKHGVLRGLHFQSPNAQGKLVSVLQGEVFDVAVDLREDSETFGRWYGVYLSAANRRQLYVPEGFAHGFVVTGEDALFLYKCTAPYDKASERSIRWDDPEIGIEWPAASPLLSPKDAAAPLMRRGAGFEVALVSTENLSGQTVPYSGEADENV